MDDLDAPPAAEVAPPAVEAAADAHQLGTATTSEGMHLGRCALTSNVCPAFALSQALATLTAGRFTVIERCCEHATKLSGKASA